MQINNNLPNPEDILKQYWGYDHFRPLQKEIINSVLQGEDTLALLPTGGGKSICYQLPSLIHNGITLVITPLIALMQEQVERLKEQGISAAHISAGMSRQDVHRILNNTVEGGYKLLYISPERIQTDLFNEYLPAMNLRLIAVDEAHCVSQWGHDFRPDYLKVATLREVFKHLPVLAVTASATLEVVEDLLQQLQMKQTNVFRQSFERANLNYTVQYSEQKNNDIAEHLQKHTGSCIIYCRSRKKTELLSRQLQSMGIDALPYHAGMTNDARTENRQLWMSNRVPVMVATIAFGMGIDKPDVQSVLHYDVPEHLEAYYQESGRAGRDGKRAYSVMFYNQQDINRLEESTETQFPPFEFIRKVYQSVAEYLQIPTGTEPYRYYNFDLQDFCTKFKLSLTTTACALKLLEQEGLWTLTESVLKPATVQIMADRQELDHIGKVYPDLHMVITTMLRLYGSLFYHPTVINHKVIAKHLRIKPQLVIQLLQQLDKMELIQYNRPKDGPQLFFHHYRVESQNLIINTERINALKNVHKARTNAMIHFTSNKTVCRTIDMLRYFGEERIKNCGHCDVCHTMRGTFTAEQTIQQHIIRSVSSYGGLGPVRIAELCRTLHLIDKDELMSSVRKLIDEGILGYDKATASVYLR
ncbi:MAG: RecQ family ATP-dependent DNA helicase [Chitinophagales bacterium]|nr:RecQ family ATP-dependent DNA helicase [Chitinophagales bacterium]